MLNLDTFCQLGNVKMNPFKSFYVEMKLINDRIDRYDLNTNETTDNKYDPCSNNIINVDEYDPSDYTPCVFDSRVYDHSLDDPNIDDPSDKCDPCDPGDEHDSCGNDTGDKHDLYGSDSIDILQLCHYYKVKPWKNKLKELILNNETFRDFIYLRQRKNVADGWLWYIWQSMGIAKQLFSWYWSMEETCLGKPAFFADSAVVGNFDIYNAFVKSLNVDVMKLRQYNLATQSIFAMFGVFLRRDLAMNYVHHENVFFHGAETMAYVIQPQLLSKYRKTLIEDCMFVLNDKDEWEFDLIKNQRYHPNERLKFLRMLTNSTNFAQGYLHHFPRNVNCDVEVVTTVHRLYTSFQNFKADWMLDDYQDLKDNVDKQKEVYELFKYYVQYLFGIAFWFVDEHYYRFAPDIRNKTITEANTNGICDASGLDIGRPIEDGFKFIDLSDDMIKSEKDLTFFIGTLRNTRVGEISEADLVHELEQPHLVETVMQQTNVPNIPFQQVYDVRNFLQRRWQFGSWNKQSKTM